MGKTWFQKWFGPSPGAELEPAPVEADRGNADVQFGLGLKYASGAGVTQDYIHAAEWYHKAADQNHSLAQFNLGVMYARGQGVPRNDAQSEVWIGKAARQGDAGAQYILGMKHVRGSYACRAISLNPKSKVTSGCSSPPPRATGSQTSPANR